MDQLVIALETRKKEFFAEEDDNAKKEYDSYRIGKEGKDYIKVSIVGWTEEQKKALFLNSLRGMYYFAFIFTNNGFPLGSFNSFTDAIDGKTDFLWLHKKAVKWSDPEIMKKIGSQGFDMYELLFEK